MNSQNIIYLDIDTKVKEIVIKCFPKYFDGFILKIEDVNNPHPERTEGGKIFTIFTIEMSKNFIDLVEGDKTKVQNIIEQYYLILRSFIAGIGYGIDGKKS